MLDSKFYYIQEEFIAVLSLKRVRICSQTPPLKSFKHSSLDQSYISLTSQTSDSFMLFGLSDFMFHKR